jgi:hypothetical protein
MKIIRKYYRLEEAAKLLSVSSDDLIHLAAHNELDLHVLLPSHARITPVWRPKDDPFADNLWKPVSGFTVDQPIMLTDSDWRAYEADQDGAKFGHISSDTDLDGECASTPPGIEFGGWKLLDEEWNDTTVRIADCSIVIIQSEFQRLTGDERALTVTERRSLLSIIAALCDYSAIDHQGRGAATQISRLTDDIGTHVDDSTVRKWLRLIPDALEARQK